MKTSAIVRIIISSFTALILTALLISMLCGYGVFGLQANSINLPFRIGGLSLSGYLDADKYTAGGSSVKSADVNVLEINWTAGSVTVLPGEGDEISFYEAGADSLSDGDKLHWLLENGKLTLQYNKAKLGGVELFSKELNKDLTVTLPAGMTLDELELNYTSAACNISGVSARTLDVDGVSGTLALTGGDFNDADVDTVSGAVTLSGVNASSLNMDTVSGRVDISGEASDVDIETVSGEINAAFTACPASFDADSLSGNVTLSLPEGSGFSASLSTLSGATHCEFECSADGNEYRSGNGLAQIDISTTSGNISILHTK